MKTSIVFFKLFSLIALFALVSCEKSETSIADNANEAALLENRGGENREELPCLGGLWKGKFVTEAINVNFNVEFVSAFAGDDGDYEFVAIGGGDVRVITWTPATLEFEIHDGGTAYLLSAPMDPDCGSLRGKIYKGGSMIGSFKLEKV